MVWTCIGSLYCHNQYSCRWTTGEHHFHHPFQVQSLKGWKDLEMFLFMGSITSCHRLTVFLPCRRDRWDFIWENKEPQSGKLILLKGMYTSWIIIYSAFTLPRQGMILNNLLASGYFSSFSCTISSTLLIVYRIYNSVSNRDNHSKKRFMQIVDVLVQSAAAYSLALMVAAISLVVLVTSRDNNTVPLFVLQSYGACAIFYFVLVRTFGVQILGKV